MKTYKYRIYHVSNLGKWNHLFLVNDIHNRSEIDEIFLKVND